MPRLQEQGRAEVEIQLGSLPLHGEVALPADAAGVVLFAHGSGSSRHSPRNQFVAQTLREHGVGTLLFDLLTEEEEREDEFRGHLRFDIELLAERLSGAAKWFNHEHPELPLGFFGSSTGGGAALVAETRIGIPIHAIVSRGGRPDLAAAALPRVKAPTLLIVGGADTPVIAMNEAALAKLKCPKEMRLVPGASHLFSEPGALAQVAEMAARWFELHFRAA